MERIKRALELARSQRDQQHDEHVVVPMVDAGAIQETQRELQAWRTPVVSIDRARIRSERILEPGHSGATAAPYKLLRTQVLRRLEQLGANTLSVISPRANDGKTLTAINLAICLAADPNRTTLLVDFDLRRPQLAQRFGVATTLGVEACLQGRAPIEHALLKPEGYDRLTLLPAQYAVEHSSELLGSSRTGEIVSELKDRYTNRVVVFDLAPVLDADDALSFSRHMQAALLVINEGKTRREDVTRTLELLRDTPIVGTLLNASREKPGSYY